MEYSSINIFKFKISTDSLFLGGAKNKRLLEAIQNYHYLVQAYENIAKFNTDEDKSNFYYSFLNPHLLYFFIVYHFIVSLSTI